MPTCPSCGHHFLITTDERSCDRCGKSLEGRRAGARYCTDTCRQLAYRERKAAAERPSPFDRVRS